MKKYMQANQKLWDEKVAVHVGSEFYDVPGFVAGDSSLYPVEEEEIGGLVKGKTLLHLQCHFGMDTITWARRGAIPTGVDFSEKGIEQARKLAGELGVDARFIHSNIYDLPDVLDETFDIVFTSYGVLAWLPDLKAWGQLIGCYLKPGGFFYMVELHPFSMVFEDDPEGTIKVDVPYFHEDEPIEWEVEGTYADLDAKMETEKEYEWLHSMSDIVGGLLDAGLQIDYLHEFDYTVFQHFKMLNKEGRLYTQPEGFPKIPLLFSLMAHKPE